MNNWQLYPYKEKYSLLSTTNNQWKLRKYYPIAFNKGSIALEKTKIFYKKENCNQRAVKFYKY